MFFQLIKFLTVGSFNMLTDFAIFNLLLILFHPTGLASLFAVSLTSSLVATVVSYFLNFYWTFRPEGEAQHWKRFRRFVLFAIFAILVSQSIFLFTIHILNPFFPNDSILLPNFAKLIGVIIASFVNFINYRMGVFHGDDLREFRTNFSFYHSHEKNLWLLGSATLTIALLCRLAFLFLITYKGGDAVHDSSIALSIGTGQSISDTYNVNPFVFWEAFIHLFTKDPTAVAITATMIPGILLMIPVFWIGKILFNVQIGFYAALITALHPRMIAFSCNGNSEIFTLFFVSMGVLCLTILLKRRDTTSPWLALAFGLCLALFVAVRHEGFLLFLALLPTLLFIPQRVLHFAYSILGFILALIICISLSFSLVGESGFWKSHTDISKSAAEQQLAHDHDNNTGLSNTMNILLVRYPQNILYTMERFPGVVLTPLIFSAFLLPLVWRPKKINLIPFVPLLLMFIFPLAIYPFIKVEPRLFFMCLIPIHIFGFAGLLAFLAYVQPNYTKIWLRGLTSLLILYLIPVTIWYGLSTSL